MEDISADVAARNRKIKSDNEQSKDALINVQLVPNSKSIQCQLSEKVDSNVVKTYDSEELTNIDLCRAMYEMTGFLINGSSAELIQFLKFSLTHNFTEMMKIHKRQKGRVGWDIGSASTTPNVLENEIKMIREGTSYDLDVTTSQEKYGNNPPLICDIFSSKPLAQSQNVRNDFEKLFELTQIQSKFSNTFFCIGEKELQANEAILSLISRVFCAIFSSCMTEKKENIVSILHVSHDVIREMVQLIHYVRVENSGRLALNLITIADEYNLAELKVVCEEAISRNLSLENIFQVFNVASTHNYDKLKIKATEFIRNNIRSIIATPKFKELQQSNPILLVDMLYVALKE